MAVGGRRSLAIACLATWAAGVAAAERPRVALVGENRLLAEALGAALAPWDVDLLTVPDTGGPTAPEQATAMARAWDVQAAVWMIPTRHGYTLSMLDARVGEIISRQVLVDGPLDEALAAAAALSVKTLLRFTSLPPPAERFEPEPARPALRRTRLQAEASGGARLPRASWAEIEPRVGVGLSLWPAALGGRAGLALGFHAATGIPIESTEFSGRYRELSVSTAARLRFERGRAALEPFVGATLHLTTIEGAAAGYGTAGSSRANPTLDAGIRIAVRAFGSAEMGLGLSAAYAFRRQRYLARGEPVFEVGPLGLQAELWAAFPVF